ncbi:hypothetical protein BDZ97DRAFT_975720 [Flammula alnicola]|nr:hypothetical protein BDZ97DRAFT_975720 [Flammula alnicola]
MCHHTRGCSEFFLEHSNGARLGLDPDFNIRHSTFSMYQWSSDWRLILPDHDTTSPGYSPISTVELSREESLAEHFLFILHTRRHSPERQAKKPDMGSYLSLEDPRQLQSGHATNSAILYGVYVAGLRGMDEYMRRTRRWPTDTKDPLASLCIRIVGRSSSVQDRCLSVQACIAWKK